MATETTEAMHVPEATFAAVRASFAPDATFVDRMRQQMAKCKMNAPVPFAPMPQQHQQQHHQHHQSQHHQSHQSHQKYNDRAAASRGPHNTSNINNRSNRSPYVEKGRAPSSAVAPTLVGLLNKVSPKNIETISSKIVALAMSKCIATAAATIVKHSLKQSVYMSTFIRLLSEISEGRCGARGQVVSAIDFVVQAHIGQPLLSSLPPPASPLDDYDGFCARTKAIKTLMGTVAFVVGCIRAHLSDALGLDAYARFIADNLVHCCIGTEGDIETLLQVVEAFQVAADGCDIGVFMGTIRTWARSLKGKGKDTELTARARFKLTDVLGSF